MTAVGRLLPVVSRPDRTSGDRLELLTALINGLSLDPVFRDEIVRIPADHPTYRWMCAVDQCERAPGLGEELCHAHRAEWMRQREEGGNLVEFMQTAGPGDAAPSSTGKVPCRICPDRPAGSKQLRLCHRHSMRWNGLCAQRRRKKQPPLDFGVVRRGDSV
ncbi:hypothetical protein ACOZ38_28525 [Sphaerisporangium viridialbum]|uniref:hypothetical protein n=1 Tax=Sphaerisporangium viridialbum TaxID=46189 RepID=UPI003C757738